VGHERETPCGPGDGVAPESRPDDNAKVSGGPRRQMLNKQRDHDQLLDWEDEGGSLCATPREVSEPMDKPCRRSSSEDAGS
jgi:hypothetical protein